MNVSTPYIAKIETGKQTGPVELAVEFAAFFDVSLDYLLVGKGDFAEEQKRGLRMAISLLSELEASSKNFPFWVGKLSILFSVGRIRAELQSS